MQRGYSGLLFSPSLTQTTSFLAFCRITMTASLTILSTVAVEVITSVGGMRSHSFTKSTAQTAIFYVFLHPTFSLLGPLFTAFSPPIWTIIRYKWCHTRAESTALCTFLSILFAVDLEVDTVTINIITRYSCSQRRIRRTLN